MLPCNPFETDLTSLRWTEIRYTEAWSILLVVIRLRMTRDTILRLTMEFIESRHQYSPLLLPGLYEHTICTEQNRFWLNRSNTITLWLVRDNNDWWGLLWSKPIVSNYGLLQSYYSYSILLEQKIGVQINIGSSHDRAR